MFATKTYQKKTVTLLTITLMLKSVFLLFSTNFLQLNITFLESLENIPELSLNSFFSFVF